MSKSCAWFSWKVPFGSRLGGLCTICPWYDCSSGCRSGRQHCRGAHVFSDFFWRWMTQANSQDAFWYILDTFWIIAKVSHILRSTSHCPTTTFRRAMFFVALNLCSWQTIHQRCSVPSHWPENILHMPEAHCGRAWDVSHSSWTLCMEPQYFDKHTSCGPVKNQKAQKMKLKNTPSNTPLDLVWFGHLRSRLSYHLKVNPMPFAVVMANVCPCTARRQPLGCSKSKKFGEEWEKMGLSLRKSWDSWGSGRYASSGREGQEFWLWLWTFEGNWGANGVKWSGNSSFSFFWKVRHFIARSKFWIDYSFSPDFAFVFVEGLSRNQSWRSRTTTPSVRILAWMHALQGLVVKHGGSWVCSSKRYATTCSWS